jgi:hypothetical protein
MPNNYVNNEHYMSSVNIDLISNDANHSYSDTHKLWILEDKVSPPPNWGGLDCHIYPYRSTNERKPRQVDINYYRNI